MIIFGTAEYDLPCGVARNVVNDFEGIGMDALRQIVEEHVPSGPWSGLKEIIRTIRYECDCCNTRLEALILTAGGNAVDVNLYWVRINPRHNGPEEIGDCRVVVETIAGAVIYEGSCKLLPTGKGWFETYLNDPEKNALCMMHKKGEPSETT